MLNKVELETDIIRSKNRSEMMLKKKRTFKILDAILERTNLIFIVTYFSLLIFFNNLAYDYLATSSSETISIFLALTVIQFGLGFLLVTMTIKKNGLNR